jgi:Arc/MetJ-type ribon-helix-helix transcriptional regulator
MQYRVQPPNQQRQANHLSIQVGPCCDGGSPCLAVSPVQQSDNELPAESWRVSVRLDRELSGWVRNRSKEIDHTPSDVVRAAIRLAISQAARMEALLAQARTRKGMVGQRSHAAPTVCPPVQTAAKAPQPAEVPRFPSELWDVVKQMRGFGPTSRAERRRRFLQVIALAQVCLEASKDRGDAELLADLLRLGAKHRLLPV